MTYDSGADGTYISKRDRVKAGLPILRQSSKKVRVANGDTVKAEHITKLPFPQLSASWIHEWVLDKRQMMEQSWSSPRMEWRCTRRRMYWSHAKESQSSLVSVMSISDIQSHLCNKEDSGNHDNHQRKQEKLSMKLTVCMTFHPSNKQSNWCMQCVDTQSNQHGCGPSKPEIL